MHILGHKSVDSSVEAIIFDNKAVWVPDIKLPEIRAKDVLLIESNNNCLLFSDTNQNIDSNVINIFDAIGDDVIELDDDDDEEWTASKQKRVSAPNSAQGLKNVSETIASAKTFEQNISNMIQTNRSQSNQRGGNFDPNYEQILLLLTSADKDIESRQRVSRWSGHSNAPQTTNPSIPSIPLSSAYRQPLNNRQMDSLRNAGQQNRPQISRPNTRGSAPIVSVNSVTNTSTNNVSQNSSAILECNLKFVYSGNTLTAMYCPSCKESIPPNSAEQHKNSDKHKATVQTPNTTNRSEEQRNVSQNVSQPQPPIRHNYNPPNPPQRQPYQSARPQIRSYNNFNYASDAYNQWSRYPPSQQGVYNTYYNYPFPQPYIFYPQTPTYIQQVAPPAHQSSVAQNYPIMYNNPMPTTYPINTFPANQNQTNGYYNY